MKPWEKNIRKVEPYVPGEQPKNIAQNKIIKLNTNENPWPPAPGVKRVLEEFRIDPLRLYPDPQAQPLADALARYHGLNPEQVFVGVGSDDVLSVAFLTCFNSGQPILFPDITYSFYPVWADLYRIPYRRPALDEDFCLRREDYYGENGGIVIPNPNAPTSIEADQELIEDILRHNPDVVVIIDEAYIDFGHASALPLLNRYDNLLVVRTFSKSRSMAGVRIGYAMGSPELIRALNDVKFSINSYTINRLSLAAAQEALADEDYFQETVRRIRDTRDESIRRLREMGFACPDSSANFIFASHREIPAAQLFARLRERGIYVRYFDAPRIDNYLRITVGTPEEMDALFASLEEFTGRSEGK